MIIASAGRPTIAHLGRRLRTLVLDCSDVEVISSFGLGMCIELRHAADAFGAFTIIYHLSKELIGLFKMMKVDRLYTIVQTPQALLRVLGRK